jgi:hypothetical protein
LTIRTKHLSSIQPENRPLLISNVSIVEQPEKEVAIILWFNFNMPGMQVNIITPRKRNPTNPACIFNSGPSGAPGSE